MEPIGYKKPIQLNRNNTDFPLKLFEYLSNVKYDIKYSFLKYYQNIARDFVANVDVGSRGLLIMHLMGLGKSILAVSIAIDMIDERPPIILLTKSLQDNMRDSIKKYIKLRGEFEPEYYLCRLPIPDLENWIDRKFSFVSMNANNMLKQMGKAAEGNSMEDFDAALEKNIGEVLKMPSLDGKLLIVDEAHNLFRAITNGSKNALGLYEMIMKAKNIKIVFLTGTPISNDPFELVPCFNMLGSTAILPVDYSEFNKLFVDKANGKIKNREKFQNRIMGLTSYVNHHSSPGKAMGVLQNTVHVEFPDELPMEVVKVNMTDHQYVMYQLARDKEREEGANKFGNKGAAQTPAMVKPKSNAASSYRVKSRQLSNYCPNTADPVSPKFKAILANVDKHKGQLGILYSQFVGMGGLGAFSKFLRSSGWKEFTVAGATSLGDLAETCDTVLETTAMHSLQELGTRQGGHVTAGADYISNIESELLRYCGDDCSEYGFNERVYGGKSNCRKYAIISGEVDISDRVAIQRIYNSAANKYGGQIDMILLSSTGAEGLDLKNVRHIHIMEPYWNWGRVDQIKARGVRNDSHIMLQQAERNVQPYIYLAIPPQSEISDGAKVSTTDTELYEESILDSIVIESFLSAIKEVSIECMVNGEEYCRSCNPTNQLLYTDDIARDMVTSDPCKQLKEETIIAQEFEFAGTKYYYTADKDSIYDYKIIVYDSAINKYHQLEESSEQFKKVMAELYKLLGRDVL